MTPAMTLSLEQFNALPVEEARRRLLQCCGCEAWADTMLKHRLFATAEELYATAWDSWMSLKKEQWQEAFRHHPRIGDRNMARASQTGSGTWAKGEQAGVATATDLTRQALLEGNRTYEARFGHVFLICATGKSADEMLAELNRRLQHDPETELRIAAEQQAMITRLRLEKLLQP